MAKVIFWEKPGCQGNARQKEILSASGHELEVRNLLTEPWTEEGLAILKGVPLPSKNSSTARRSSSRDL